MPLIFDCLSQTIPNSRRRRHKSFSLISFFSRARLVFEERTPNWINLVIVPSNYFLEQRLPLGRYLSTICTSHGFIITDKPVKNLKLCPFQIDSTIYLALFLNEMSVSIYKEAIQGVGGLKKERRVISSLLKN